VSASDLLLIPLGFAVGAYGTVIGAGGGFMLVPLLLLIYPEYGPEQVTAISLAVVWANAASGSLAYARQRRIDYVTGLLFAACSVPGVVAGALTVHVVPERLFSVLFAVLLLAMALIVTRPAPPPTVREAVSGPGVLVRSVVTPDGASYRYAYKIWQGALVSLGVGFASSLFGIGGGVIHVPAMIVLFRIPVVFAVATSHFILAFMAGGGTAVHLTSGTLGGKPLLQATLLAAGAVPGAQAGAWIAHRIRARAVILLLAFALVALAARLLLKGIFGV
jgi:uncharacterized membrane protein YfcA